MKSPQEKVAQKLKKIFYESGLEIPDIDISENTKLFDEMGIDSLIFISAVCEIEDAFDIHLMNEEMNLQEDMTFGILTDLIVRLIDEQCF